MVGEGSIRYNHLNIYHDPALSYSITCFDRPRCWRWGGGGGQWLQMHFTLSTRVGICRRYITMEMSTDVKNNVTKKYSEKVNVSVCITKRCVK